MRFRFHDGRLIPAHLIPHDARSRSELPAPMVLRDSMDAAINPATGLLYESKSAFRKATRQAGCYEVGNDEVSQAQPEYKELGGEEADIKQAMEQLGL